MEFSLHLLGQLHTKLGVSVHEDVVSADEKLYHVSILVSFQLSQLFLEIVAFILKVQKIRHVLKQSFELACNLGILRLYELIDYPLVD